MVSGIAAAIPNGASDSGLSSDENASIEKSLRGRCGKDRDLALGGSLVAEPNREIPFYTREEWRAPLLES